MANAVPRCSVCGEMIDGEIDEEGNKTYTSCQNICSVCEEHEDQDGACACSDEEVYSECCLPLSDCLCDTEEDINTDDTDPNNSDVD